MTPEQRRALEFYANPKNWEIEMQGCASQAEADSGRRARMALTSLDILKESERQMADAILANMEADAECGPR